MKSSSTSASKPKQKPFVSLSTIFFISLTCATVASYGLQLPVSAAGSVNSITCGQLQTNSQPPLPPNNSLQVFSLDPSVLASNKAALSKPNSQLQPALQNLQEKANTLLKATVYSVTEKPKTLFGSTQVDDIHNYYSLAPYFWPDATGKFTIHKDGVHNPIVSKFPDGKHMSQMTTDFYTLALASYFSNGTQKEQYANKAAQIVVTWFLDKNTCMNPNLDHGQMVIGVTPGRQEGILDARDFAQVVDGIGLLNGTQAWTLEDQRGMIAWFRAYLNWLLHSQLGQIERKSTNNHGTWYDEQAIPIALFVGDRQDTQTLLGEAKTRINKTINSDGSQPLELKRTKSLSYSAFNLEALYILAGQSSNLSSKNNLWSYVIGGGQGKPILQSALDYILPTVTGSQTWDQQQITGFDPKQLASPFYQAAMRYGSLYLQAYQKLEGSDVNIAIYPLIYR